MRRTISFSVAEPRENPELEISPSDRKAVESIFEKLRKEKERGKTDVRLASFSQLFKMLSREEASLVKRIVDTDPSGLGFKGKYLGAGRVPGNLVAIRGQKYSKNGETSEIEPQYLPRPAFKAYKGLDGAMRRDMGRGLLVLSGYRSPAYQSIVFLWNLRRFGFDMKETAGRVALPGYSEHGFPKRQAVDFITEDGTGVDDASGGKFSETEEYEWLVRNADKFGFYQSYPENNSRGIVFEPWHWHFDSSRAKRAGKAENYKK